MHVKRSQNTERSGKLDRLILAVIILLVVAAISAMTWGLFPAKAASALGQL